MDDGRDEDGGWMAFHKKKKKLWSLSLFSLNSVWSMADDDDDMPLLLLTAFEVVLSCAVAGLLLSTAAAAQGDTEPVS